MDWGRGQYERMAVTLAPAAREVVRVAGIGPGDRVLDLGCGTGNAALEAAAVGARVTGVDPAERLLDVARDRAAAAGLDAVFLPGDTGTLPGSDGDFDAILSVFSVILAPDPAAAVTGILRALRPQGRLVFSAFIPNGAVWRLNSAAAQLIRDAIGAPPPPPPFPWHDADALCDLFAPYGWDVAVERHALEFTARSPEEFLAEQTVAHPVVVTALAALDRLGRGQAARDQLLRVLAEDNEDPRAFRSTGRYVVAAARRAG